MENDGEAGGATIAMQVLQPLLPEHPDASGLIHFYVHATENAGVPQLAEPYADRLAQLAPMASHMVHMPSHTYYRVGRYEDAALANLAALRVDQTLRREDRLPDPARRPDVPLPRHPVRHRRRDDGRATRAAALQLVSAFNRDFPSPAAYNPRQQIAAGQTYAALGRFAAPADGAGRAGHGGRQPVPRSDAPLRPRRGRTCGSAAPGDARAEAALVAAPPAAVAPPRATGRCSRSPG